uniref:NADH-ubiquinone oxidoreductase chain 1 n=1 Tax=Doliolum nationalis TaxID=76841 RepID=Q5KT40_DOLNA|nr:NADH dehydrogenase subunit 1 [Doliolum nationalis]
MWYLIWGSFIVLLVQSKTIWLLLVALGLLLMVAFLVLIERNILGLVQERKGPNVVGVYGVVQTVMDGGKLLLKQMVLADGAHLVFFIMSPIVCFILSLFSWAFVPVPFLLVSSKYSILVTLFISSILVYPVLWAGWSSGSMYSLLGGVRAVAQMVSYEVVMGIFIAMIVLLFGYPSWEGFLYYELHGNSFGLFWLTFIAWIAVMLAELNRSPFDLVEGESELVSGFNVEYSGYGFTLLFLAEYMNIWLMGFITALMFFGGSQIVLGTGVVFSGLYVRSMVPRLKSTDLIMLTWKTFLPFIILALILSTGLIL